MCVHYQGCSPVQAGPIHHPSTPQTDEVHAAVAQKAALGIPAFNIVVMHACSTLGASGNGSYQVPTAFGIMSRSDNKPTSVIPNKGYAGFSAVVFSWGVDTSVPLDEHASMIYDELAAGKTLSRAVQDANDAKIPKEPRRASSC